MSVPPGGIQPPLLSAYRTALRIPAPGMRTHSRVSAFRTHETQTGPGALSTPGTAVLTGRQCICGRRLPPLSGWSLPPRRHNPARDVEFTRHQQGFPGSRPSGPFPAPVTALAGTAVLGLFRELRTQPVRNRPRTGTGRAQTRRYVSGISQTSLTSALTTCDLVSQSTSPASPATRTAPGPPSRLATCSWTSVTALRTSGSRSATGPARAASFDAALAGAGIEAVQIPPRSPRANGCPARFVLTARTGVTDRMLIFGQRHLRLVLAEYEAHDNGRRPHRSRQLCPPRPPGRRPLPGANQPRLSSAA